MGTVNLQLIVEQFENEELTKADGFDEAIIGVETNSMRLIYSVSKCLDILSRQMDRMDAYEYFYFNVEGAYIGDKTPIWCNDTF